MAPLSQLSFVELDDDPLASHRPDEIDCNSLVGWTIEAGLLEVDTAQCNYLAVSEPAVIAAPAGVWVKTRVTHFDLTAAEPAEAHLAILVRQTLMWETTIAIPSPGEVLELSFELPVDVEVGDPVVIHLHNHGQNSWNFEPLVVTSQP